MGRFFYFISVSQWVKLMLFIDLGYRIKVCLLSTAVNLFLLPLERPVIVVRVTGVEAAWVAFAKAVFPAAAFTECAAKG